MVIIQTYNTRYSEEPWTAWLTDCETSETLGSAYGDSEAEVIGKIILEFPAYFERLQLNRIPFR